MHPATDLVVADDQVDAVAAAADVAAKHNDLPPHAVESHRVVTASTRTAGSRDLQPVDAVILPVESPTPYRAKRLLR